MNAKWFYGVVNSRDAFVSYVESTYTYNKLISIHSLELREIAKEMLFFADKWNVKLPDYIKSMSEDPVSFYEAALDMGIEPDYSEITHINNENGTNFRNMIEYLEHMRKKTPRVPDGDPQDPLVVLASDEIKTEENGLEVVDDEEAYLAAFSGKGKQG